MPTWERTARFARDWATLTAEERERFRVAARHFVADLRTGRFRPGLRVKGVQGVPGVFEMTWAPDGRATFQLGPGGEHGAHVVWRRLGRHVILREPWEPTPGRVQPLPTPVATSPSRAVGVDSRAMITSFAEGSIRDTGALPPPGRRAHVRGAWRAHRSSRAHP